tara:strand:- start:113 stop:565 length:453 start_codon:yes stop_codon:yes gene_type:complete
MSKRLIDSSILTTPDLVDLGLKEFRIWVGLCVLTDDYGWVSGDPRYLRNRIAPGGRISKDHIIAILNIFQERSMLVSYTFGDLKALRLTNFSYYQKLRKPRDSKYEALLKRREKKERNGAFSVPETPSAASVKFMEKITDGSAFTTEAQG